MANTYTLIEAKTLGSAVASVTFSSIPQTYTDLQILVSGRSTRSNTLDDTYLNFNSSTANFTGIILYTDNGSSLGSFSSGRSNGFLTGDSATSNIFSNMSIYITNYASSSFKSVSSDAVTENNATATGMSLAANLWSDTAAITSINLSFSSFNFLANSTFYLYGIKNS
jgi:hypothetical protein